MHASVFWRRMEEGVEDYVRTCFKCAGGKSATRKVKQGTLVPTIGGKSAAREKKHKDTLPSKERPSIPPR